MALLSLADLSYVLPVTAVGYVIAAFLGKTFLSETVSNQRWLGTALIFLGAALVSSRPGRFEVLDSILHTDGAYRDDLTLDWGSALRMNGLTVILQAARKLPTVIGEVLTRQNIEPKDVVQFVMHQANQNLIVRVAKAMGVDASLMFSNVAKYGNTSSASMLIAAAEWEPSPGPVVFAGFGAGFNWGALVARSV